MYQHPLTNVSFCQMLLVQPGWTVSKSPCTRTLWHKSLSNQALVSWKMAYSKTQYDTSSVEADCYCNLGLLEYLTRIFSFQPRATVQDNYLFFFLVGPFQVWNFPLPWLLILLRTLLESIPTHGTKGTSSDNIMDKLQLWLYISL